MTYQRLPLIISFAIVLPAIVLLASCRPAPPPSKEPAAATESIDSPEVTSAVQAVPDSRTSASTATPTDPVADPVPAIAAPAPVASILPACTVARAAGPVTLDAYKRDVACRIHARNGGHLYDGAPPPVLRSVVVLSVRIDAAGRPVKIGVLRSNGVRELERRAMQSVRDAVPLPAPGKEMLRQGMADITETWLFRDDGRFQVRTLAAVQAPSGY